MIALHQGEGRGKSKQDTHEFLMIHKACPNRTFTDARYGIVPLRKSSSFNTNLVLGETKNRCVQHAASHERRWTQWKAGCPDNVECNCKSSSITHHIQFEKLDHKPLFVCISAHIEDESSYTLLLKLVCTIRRHHGSTAVIFVYDNGSPWGYHQKIKILCNFENHMILERSQTSQWEWGAINASLHWLSEQDRFDHFSHYTYLQHSMSLKESLPLANLACPLVSFSRFGPGYLDGRTDQAIVVSNWMWTLDNKLKIEHYCRIYEMVYFTYSVSFVAHIWAIKKLHFLGVFSKITVSTKEEDQASERLMGAVADWFLQSSPEQCNLDGDYRDLPRYVEKVTHGAGGYAPVKTDSRAFLDQCSAINDTRTTWPVLNQIEEAIKMFNNETQPIAFD